MKHLILAILAATFSLSALADRTVERGKPSKEQRTREQALSGTDTCKFTIDQKGVKRLATEQQQKKCEEKYGKGVVMPRSGIGIGDEGNNSGLSKPDKK